MKKNDFAVIRKQFPNDEAILTCLRPYGAFQRVGRATLSRWARAEKLPRRGAIAVSILERSLRLNEPVKIEEVYKIPIFHHPTELALPAVVAYRGIFPDSCAARLNIHVELDHTLQTYDGSQALDQLAECATGFALADRSVLKEGHRNKSCLPVCVIATSFPLVVSTMRIRRMSDLSHVHFYCPEGSSLVRNIRSALMRRGIEHNEMKITELPESPSLNLSRKYNHCFVGWSNWISDIRKQVPNVIEVKSRTIGLNPVRYTLFAKPGALTFRMVGEFLLSLNQLFVSKDVSKEIAGLRHTDDDGFIKRHLGKSVVALLKAVKDRDVEFKLGNLDTSTVLEFLKRETSHTGGVT